jgi:cytochrome c-type biogenesis protein CcsB
MDRIVNLLISRQLTGILFIMLASVLAVGTFLENDFGYSAARAMVYNTWWFEMIFLLLAINMFGNLFDYNMWCLKRAPVLLFHLAFFIILAGAAITRYIGYEGNMPIREGETSNIIYTSDNYVTINISDKQGTRVIHEQVFLSRRTPHEFSKKLNIGGERYQVKSVGYAQYPALGSARITFRIFNDQIAYNLLVSGKNGKTGQSEDLKLPKGNISIRYGSLPIELPFSIKLNNFQIERYPGSESPSSYTSEVTVTDPVNNRKMDYRIFMNNVLNYGGYRFYQSSYDRDEKGTILSVNHDFTGTLITYIGYFLLSVSMLWSLFAPHTRFRKLLHKTNKLYEQRKTIVTILALLLSLPSFSQNMPSKPDAEIAAKFGQLWIQDKGGRIKPLNSMHQEVMVKLVKHNSFKGFNPDQMLLGMLTYPAEWQQVPLITVNHPELKKTLGITGRKASFNNFFDKEKKQQYKIKDQVDLAYRKKPAERDKIEQELIKVDEQVNVFYMAMTGCLYRLFPVNNSTEKAWFAPSAIPDCLPEKDSLFVTSSLSSFITTVQNSNLKKAARILDEISNYQEAHAGNLLPQATKLKAEILYNRLNIFMWLAIFFFIFGILLLLYNITSLVYPPFLKNRILESASWLIIVGFAWHSFGIGLRWYVSGHAPWSNGYESMIFIAWALLLAGLLFSRRSPLVLSVTALFAGIVLLVAHLSWMNPQITNLVPVLKSYWLTLHVAIIIGGYGFMTLGALLGFLNLFLTGLQTHKNRVRISLAIDELTAINEMALVTGLYLMTIGSFLGAIWANESWGRYWGWDPKETWSLITVLIYAFVVHMRMIPGLRGRLAFNTASLLSFASVVMTYLGVNYYLTGLHSYAAGDPVPVPAATCYILIIVALLIGYAWWKEKSTLRDRF